MSEFVLIGMRTGKPDDILTVDAPDNIAPVIVRDIWKQGFDAGVAQQAGRSSGTPQAGNENPDTICNVCGVAFEWDKKEYPLGPICPNPKCKEHPERKFSGFHLEGMNIVSNSAEPHFELCISKALLDSLKTSSMLLIGSRGIGSTTFAFELKKHIDQLVIAEEDPQGQVQTWDNRMRRLVPDRNLAGVRPLLYCDRTAKHYGEYHIVLEARRDFESNVLKVKVLKHPDGKLCGEIITLTKIVLGEKQKRDKLNADIAAVLDTLPKEFFSLPGKLEHHEPSYDYLRGYRDGVREMKK